MVFSNNLQPFLWRNSILGVIVLFALLRASGAEEQPRVAIFLEAKTQFVGEMSKVVVVVTAPAERDINVITENAIDDREYIRIDVIDAAGIRVPGGPADTQAPAINFVRRLEPLPHGESTMVLLPSLTRPSKAGQYTVRVWGMPTGEKDLVIKKELPLRLTDIDTANVVAGRTLTVPESRTKDSPTARVELLNVKDAGSHVLIFRKTESHQILTERVTRLDATSGLIAVPKFFEPFAFDREIWVAFEKDQSLFYARISYISGKVKELGPLRTSVQGQ